jgi:phosphatidylinositol-bisphosphatase
MKLVQAAISTGRGQSICREAEYTEYRALRLFVGTWNVNGKFPKEDLTPWLCDGADADAEGKLTLPDVYIVGYVWTGCSRIRARGSALTVMSCSLQEMVDLTVTNVALGGQSGKRSDMWVQLLDRALNDAALTPSDRYELIGTRYLVGILIAVFVKTKYKRFVSDIQDAEAPVGVMGVMGNKGGVSLRLQIFDSTFCFVCAHLAAHRNAVAQRNADFASIMAKTEFRDEAALAAGRAAGTFDIGKLTILDHDFVVWFGDFNYRIVETVSTERCFELACGSDADLEQLRQRDQLNIERAAQRSFHGFQEGMAITC